MPRQIHSESEFNSKSDKGTIEQSSKKQSYEKTGQFQDSINMTAVSNHGFSAETTPQETMIVPVAQEAPSYVPGRNMRFNADQHQVITMQEVAGDSDHTPSPEMSRFVPTPLK